MIRRSIAAFTNWEFWMVLATLLFSGWYAVFLFRFRVAAVLSDVASVVHGFVPVVPAVKAGAARALVGTVTALGIPAAVVTFFVAFALFHRQTDVT